MRILTGKTWFEKEKQKRKEVNKAPGTNYCRHPCWFMLKLTVKETLKCLLCTGHKKCVKTSAENIEVQPGSDTQKRND